MKKKSLIMATCVALALVLGLAGTAAAASIDYLATAISPAANFNGQSGNFALINPVAGGDTITFDLKFYVHTQGDTATYPRTITFGTHPDAPSVTFNGAAATTVQHEFTSAASIFTDTVTVVAPNTPGDYNFKIMAIDQSPDTNHGLTPGGGILVHFTVANSTGANCDPVNTAISLTLAPSCILYHSTSTTFTAVLTSGGSPVTGQTIDFSVDDDVIGSATTDTNGAATVAFNPSSLKVGDHTVDASFQGVDCLYNGSGQSATLGVNYMFVGYQQPINADGSSLFGGRTIPVKIKIADANGVPVPDADAHVFFSFGTGAFVGSDSEPLANTNGDLGNAMRYDPTARQYIFNWDIAGLANGTYKIRVGLGEGTCADQHIVVVTLKKKGSK